MRLKVLKPAIHMSNPKTSNLAKMIKCNFWSREFFQNLKILAKMSRYNFLKPKVFSRIWNFLNQCWELSGPLVRNDGPEKVGPWSRFRSEFRHLFGPFFSLNFYPGFKNPFFLKLQLIEFIYEMRGNELFRTSPNFWSGPSNNHQC